MADRAPVLLLTFHRPDLAARTAAAIAAYGPTVVFHASDGPRSDEERAVVEATRAAVTEAFDGVCAVANLYRDANLGCKRAVESAISWFFEHVDEGVILEDDCIPGRPFFDFCDEMLERYRVDERVMHVSGYHHGASTPGRFVFSQYPRVWGWATWRRAWYLHDPEVRSPTGAHRRAISSAFGSSAEARHYLGRLDQVASGALDTWDYGWTYSVVTNRGLAVQPLVNLVHNVGWGDPGAAHTTAHRPDVENNLPVVHSMDFSGPSSVFPDYEFDRAQFMSFGSSRKGRLAARLPGPVRERVTGLLNRS